MPALRVESSVTEPIFIFALDKNSGLPLTGKTDLYVRIYSDSLMEFLDWNDLTFKPSGWVTRDQLLTEVDAALLPGLYEVTGGLDLSSVTNLPADANLVVSPLQTPGVDAALPAPCELKVDQWVGALTAGLTGSVQIDVTVEDTGATPIQGAVIDVYDATNTFFLFRYYTDTIGQVSLALDPGTYSLRIMAVGYSFTVPETLVVTVDASVIYTGMASSPGLITIFGTVKDASDTPIDGACVEVFATVPQVVGGSQLGEPIVSTFTDALGQFSVDLLRNAQVIFRITDPEGNLVVEFEAITPDLPTIDLASWQPLP